MSKTVTTTTTAANQNEETKKEPAATPAQMLRIYGSGAGAFLVAIIIVVILYAVGVGSLIKSIAPVSGVSIFAIFYLMAQFDERVVEPFSNLGVFGGHDNPDDPKQKQARAVALWLVASGIGILISYVTVGILTTVGVTFVTSISASSSHILDAVVSGTIIGGGTKPLHDLINYFDTSGSKVSSSGSTTTTTTTNS